MRNPNIRSEEELEPDNTLDKPPSIKPRLIKGMQADYVPATYDPAIGNPSGLSPYGPNVLVRIDACSDKTQGGIHLPEDIVERMTEAAVTGCIYAIGDDAFTGMRDRPMVGYRVCFEKYAGIRHRGKDGHMYRFIDEKCIAGRVEDDLCIAENLA
jgi:co-chaperonin GroES (HSP10)